MTLPGVGASILPKLACPACWPAYAALLSSVGLGFLISTVYLLPMTVALLSLALGAIAFRAKQRNGYGPLLLGLLATAAVLLAWPRHAPSEVAMCPGCERKEVR